MEIFSYDFMQRAFLAAFCMAIIAPQLGVFLIIRRQSLLADTLSHVSLTGVAFGLLLQVSPTLVTLIVVAVAAFFLEYLRMIYHSYSEVAIAILMSGGLALALVLMHFAGGNSSTNLQQYLFGSIVTISAEQVWILAGLSLLLCLIFIILRRPLYVMTFDEEMAFVEGLPTSWMSLLFNVVTGVAIAVMIPIAGALLISAIMVLPAAIGMRLGNSFRTVQVLGVIIGLFGMFSGLFASFHLDLPPGATITLIFILFFLLLQLGNALFVHFFKRKQNNPAKSPRKM